LVAVLVVAAVEVVAVDVVDFVVSAAKATVPRLTVITRANTSERTFFRFLIGNFPPYSF
jgi:hypothetical protein